MFLVIIRFYHAFNIDIAKKCIHGVGVGQIDDLIARQVVIFKEVVIIAGEMHETVPKPLHCLENLGFPGRIQ